MPAFRVRADQSERGVLLQAPSAAAAIVRACLEHPDDVGIVVLRATEASRCLAQPSPEQVQAAVRDLLTAYGYSSVLVAMEALRDEYEAAAAEAAVRAGEGEHEPEEPPEREDHEDPFPGPDDLPEEDP